MKSEYKTELIVAILAAFAAIASAIIAYISLSYTTKITNVNEKELARMVSEFDQSLEERKFSFEERRNAYREFFDGTSRYWEAKDKMEKAAEAEKNGRESEAEKFKHESKMLFAEYNRLWTPARFKIGVFSDAAVISSIANYWNKIEIRKGGK